MKYDKTPSPLTSHLSPSDGQSLIELLVGLGVGAIIILGISTIISANLKSSLNIKNTQLVASFNQEILDSARLSAGADWHNIYNLTKGQGNNYYISSSTQAVVSGKELIVADGKNFFRYFYVQNVSRDQCGIGEISTSATTTCSSGPGSGGIASDPLIQKVIAVIEDANNQVIITQDEYVARSRNYSFSQGNWSGGGGQVGAIIGPNDKFSTSTGINYSSGTLQLQL